MTRSIDESHLVRWRQLDSLVVLRTLADYVKVEMDFKPVRALSTRRVHVTAAGVDYELLLDGPKFYDTRARTGGGGAVDLLTHLWNLPFKKAAEKLLEAEL